MAGNSFIRERLAHFTFAWYTFPMSTGGLALVLITNPADSQELRVIGKLLFFINIIIFLSISATLVVRFATKAASFIAVMRHPIESLFIGPMFLAMATIINCASVLAGPEASENIELLLRILFWTYTALTFTQSIISYTILFTEGKHTLQMMTPGWVLPIFPVMLVGTVANAVIPTQPPQRAFEMAIAGVTFQGLGFFVSVMMYAVLLLRLMTCGLPHANHRPGLFICVGPPSFTIIALLGIAEESSRFLPESGLLDVSREQLASAFVMIATCCSVFLWMVSAWFWCLAVVTIVVGTIQDPSHMTFILAWWAFVFPNVGFTIATVELSDALQSSAIRGLAIVLMIFLIIAWCTVLCFHFEAVISKKIMWHGKDEDRDMGVTPALPQHKETHGPVPSESVPSSPSQKLRFKSSRPTSPDATIDVDEYGHERAFRSDRIYFADEQRPDRHVRSESLRQRHPSAQRAPFSAELDQTTLSSSDRRHYHSKQPNSLGGRSDSDYSLQWYDQRLPYDARVPSAFPASSSREVLAADGHGGYVDWYSRRGSERDISGVQTAVGTPYGSPKHGAKKLIGDELQLTEIQIADDPGNDDYRKH